jgi:hypothetical protein
MSPSAKSRTPAKPANRKTAAPKATKAPTSPTAAKGADAAPTPPAANPSPQAAATPTATKAAKPERRGKVKPLVTDAAKPKKVGALEAAAMVLAEAKKPMNTKEIYAAIESAKLWKTFGKTPDATLYAAIIREIAGKGDKARFRKAERGRFTLANA